MTVIDDYLLNLHNPQRCELEKIRKIIKRTIPNIKEVISYGIPVFMYKSKYLIGFAAFKKHLSLFPESGPIEAYKFDLRQFKVARGTIRFTTENTIPEALIIKILRYNQNKIDNMDSAKE